MYTTNHLDKVQIIDRYWLGVGIMNMANHLYVHD